MITAEFISHSIGDRYNAKIIHIGQGNSPSAFVRITGDKISETLIYLSTGSEGVFAEAVEVLDDVVVIAVGEQVHFIDPHSQSYSSFQLDGYFGYLYLPEDLEYAGEDFGLLVASASHLYRFTRAGDKVWRSDALGIDGVVVEKLDPPYIQVSGEWDPPDGWLNAKVNIESGVVEKYK